VHVDLKTALAGVLGLVVLALPLGAAEAQPRRTAPTGDFNLYGTEPFWEAQVRRGRLSMRADGEGWTVRADGPRIRGGRSTWRSRSGAVSFVIWRGLCDDGMSERIYPYFAEIRWESGTVHQGCAYRPNRP
jgi:uncharacterized membrane protein